MAVKTPPCQEWSIREKLCLASAVMRSGDQNWMSVSRAIKPFPEPGRPPDWNTTKNCAIQYSAMLSEVDTPKRKRSGDKGESVETPGDLIVKKMTFDRVEELKQMLADDRRKFKLLRDEIESIEKGHLDEKLPEILQDIREKQKQAEAQKLAEEAAVAELLARKEEQKKQHLDKKAQRESETTEEPTTAPLPKEKKMVDTDDQPKETVTSTKETEEAKDLKTSPVPPKQAAAPPTPVVLQALLVSDKKEEKKKESMSQEDISDIKAMLAKPADSKPSTSKADVPAPAESKYMHKIPMWKQTPTLSKLLLTSSKTYTSQTPTTATTVEAKGTLTAEQAKTVQSTKVPIVVEPEQKEEVQVMVVDESSVDSPTSAAHLPVPGLENEDSSDVSLVASTAPSSPSTSKTDEQKKRKRGRPKKKLKYQDSEDTDALEVRSVGESADETKDGARSEAAESEEMERPSESDRDDVSLSNVPGTGSVFSESLPNSPASLSQLEDHHDYPYRSWKKAIMLVWREAASHKYANLFLHPVTDEIAPGYSSTVYRGMDLSTIKKNIENGTIKTTKAFQRDIMLMFQNAIMYNRSDHDVYRMACDMQTDVLKIIEEFLSTQLLAQNPEASKSLRGRRTMDLSQKEEEKPRRSGGEAEHTSGKKRKTRGDEL
ncbi:Bromodomain-containing protein 8 [Holothuria leucospilota]|uniref:Bromodomain-containing protein 8 n=1 Tax=Holothuria leucospilota TaxID=206669 RepID=A0A9Q0YNN1_HOLLE|nr:Bromodomain-containing protein 8 [Holothuria leucospilota]